MVMTLVVMVLMMVMTMVILMVMMMVNICRDFQGYADKEATKKKVMKDVWRKGDMCFRCLDNLMMMMIMDVMMVVSESLFHFQGLGTSW